MNSQLFWILILLQILLGAFDTLYHHEFKERLAWRQSQRTELKLHAVRNMFYAIIFLAIGWVELTGFWAVALMVLLGGEVLLTLWDFVEEDQSRILPASERVTHALLAVNYGAILTILIPHFWANSLQGMGVELAYYGAWSWVCGMAAIAVFTFGLRDYHASRRLERIDTLPACQLSAGLTGRKKVLITGATGFIGKRLTQALVVSGHQVIAYTRNPDKTAHLPSPIRIITSFDQIGDLEQIDSIIHLAGEPVANGLWTNKKRQKIIQSRVNMTREIIQLIKRLVSKPDSFLAASAIGWYGLNGNEPITEDGQSTLGFTHEVCEATESAARNVEIFGVRVVRLRIGLVLGVEGGFLANMLVPFDFGMGGSFGKGAHYMSWISRDDAVRMMIFAMRDKSIAGPLNVTAPNPVTNTEFSQTLGLALARPVFMKAPAAPLEFLAGDYARELLLGGQRIIPQKAKAAGFQFKDLYLLRTLQAITGAKSPDTDKRVITPTQKTMWKLRPYFPW